MTRSDSTILAIDHGTQSIRAILFDLDGQIVAKSQIAIEPYYSEHPGWAEQDPLYYWQQLTAACQQLWQMDSVDRATIRSVALTTQRNTIVTVGADGSPLRPAIHWLDQRHLDEVPPLPSPWRYLIKAAGENEAVHFYRAHAECNWIAHHQPLIWAKTHKYLMLSGYLSYRLCGRFADATASQVGYLPLNFKRHQWYRDQDWRWKALTLTPSQLPELLPPGSVLGQVTEEASRITGIPKALPLIAAGSDKACEAIGSGAIDSDTGSISYGTTATFNCISPRYFEAVPFLPPFPAAIPDHFTSEVIVHRGYWMVNWFKTQFAHAETEQAMRQGCAVEQLFETLLQQTPAGAMGLTLQPFWSPGIRKPGPEAKGAIIGFGDVHTKAHLYRAIIEGIAYALRTGKERVEKRSGIPIKEIMVSGGGSQSEGVMQITADIFNLPATRPHTYEASGLGAAINGAVGAGLFPNHRAAINTMTHKGKTFTPNPAHRELYDGLFREVYSPMYRALRPLYKAIRSIADYP